MTPVTGCVQDLAVVVLLMLIPLLAPSESGAPAGLTTIAKALGIAALKVLAPSRKLSRDGRPDHLHRAGCSSRPPCQCMHDNAVHADTGVPSACFHACLMTAGPCGNGLHQYAHAPHLYAHRRQRMHVHCTRSNLVFVLALE